MSGAGRIAAALHDARAAVLPAFGLGAIAGMLAGVPVLLAGGAGAAIGLVGGGLVGLALGGATGVR